jgi:2-dehydro-3-deoxyglucarate aldolase/4-hydroxy-2-oxoheptanedioate aldolase
MCPGQEEDQVIETVRRFKQRIRDGKVNVGTVVSFADPAISELFANAGYDFVWIDMEHGPITLDIALHHVMALHGTEAASIIRVPCDDINVIKPILDLAPAGILVPQIRTAREAADVVRACKYPPRGERGFGPRRGIRYGAVSGADYLAHEDEQLMIFIQIEHIDAVRNLDSILAVAGLDGILVGPNDLAGSMGKLGQAADPEVIEAIDLVIKKTRQTNLFVGVGTGYRPDTLSTWLEKGIQWIALENDCSHLYKHSKMVADAVHNAPEKEGVKRQAR